MSVTEHAQCSVYCVGSICGKTALEFMPGGVPLAKGCDSGPRTEVTLRSNGPVLLHPSTVCYGIKILRGYIEKW